MHATRARKFERFQVIIARIFIILTNAFPLPLPYTHAYTNGSTPETERQKKTPTPSQDDQPTQARNQSGTTREGSMYSKDQKSLFDIRSSTAQYDKMVKSKITTIECSKCTPRAFSCAGASRLQNVFSFAFSVSEY